MSNIIGRFVSKVEFWMQRRSEVARFHEIILADLRGTSLHFRTTLLGALQLILDYDPRRFGRVQRHIRWVVNRPLALGRSAEYHSHTRTCEINFQEPKATENEPWHKVWHVAFNAMCLVHEATHGELTARGISYTAENRVRIENICVQEENRFLRRVETRAKARSEVELEIVVHHLQREFDSSTWQLAWNATRWQQAVSVLKQEWR